MQLIRVLAPSANRLSANRGNTSWFPRGNVYRPIRRSSEQRVALYCPGASWNKRTYWDCGLWIIIFWGHVVSTCSPVLAPFRNPDNVQPFTVMLYGRGMHKPLATKSLMVVPNTCRSSYHPSGAKVSEAASRFLEELWTLAVESQCSGFWYVVFTHA
jgi:hypothetical protein